MASPGALVVGVALAAATTVVLAALARVTRRRRDLAADLATLTQVAEALDSEPLDSGPPSSPGVSSREGARLLAALEAVHARYHRSQARRQEAEGTLGHVLDHAPDAVIVLDAAHQIISWNRGAEDTFGYPAAEMIGRPYATLVPGRTEEPELERALEDGSTVNDLRTRRLASDGRIIDVSLNRARVPSPVVGGERFVEILRDVTETRRQEESFIQTEKMAAVGKISSKVVHEIRNPLASINLNVDLLQETLDSIPGGIPDPEAREILGVIKREVRRLSQITEEYLQFSRLPHAVFRREKINELLIELADLVRPSISRRGVHLVLNLDEAQPEAVCDATLLRQALLNLLRNAMDATEQGKGQIQMGTRLLAGEEGEAVAITVEDNGRGIEPGVIDRIYEPFFTSKKDGTGLGLALVRRAIDEHNGSIQCVSVPGRGTTFRVILQLHRASIEYRPA